MPPRDSPVRLPSFSASRTETRVALSAGISPKKMPAASETAAVKKSTVRLSENDAPATCWGIRRPRTRHNILPSHSPSAPPASERSKLSVRSCATICLRLAPSAIRTAISRRRPEARASRRLARFEHAIRSTKMEAICRTHRPARVSPAYSCWIGTTTAPILVLDFGYC